MAKTLITGSSGLIGGNLARKLAQEGRELVLLSRSPSFGTNLDELGGVTIAHGDVTDLSSMVSATVGCEIVYHCAAVVSAWNGNASKIWDVNVVGTQNVIDACIINKVKRLVYCSSVDAFGVSTDGLPVNENAPWNWDELRIGNPYARSKRDAQKRVFSAKEKLDIVVVNPTYVLGPYDFKPSSGKMIVALAHNKVPGYTKGGNNFVSVHDVVQGMISAEINGKSGESYILGSHNLHYQEMFAKILAGLGIKRTLRQLPFIPSMFFGYIGDLVSFISRKESLISSNIVKLGNVDHFYSSNKARELLGLQARPIEDTIEETIKWFRDVGRIN